MRGMHYSRASRRSEDAPMDPHVAEALAIHASKRPAKSPPKVMPVTPTLPKVVRGRKRRRTV